jgi:hypothetical protein
MPWPVEEIPDEDAVYLRIHHTFADNNGKPIPGAFRNNPKGDPAAGMSVNWERYSTAEDTRRLGCQKPASEYAVARLITGSVRELPGQTVLHEPLEDNRSHSEVFGEKSTEVRLRFLAIYELVLDFDPSFRRTT